MKNHLNDVLLVRLISGEATETERFSCAEHLSICDRCLKKYTRLLTDEICLTPPDPIAPRVKHALRKRVADNAFRRCTAAAAAILLAMGLWLTDAFTFLVPGKDPPSLSAPVQRERIDLSDRLNGFFNDLSDSMTELALTYPDPRTADDGDSTIKES